MPDETENELQESAAEGATEGSGEPEKTEEYFLTVNDRTRYQTAEDAKAGFVELQKRLLSYNELGDPEQIREAFRERERLRRALLGDDAKTPRKSKLKPEEKEAWDRHMSVLREEFGVPTADELREIKESVRAEVLAGRAYDAMDQLLEQHGIKLSEEQEQDLEIFAEAVIGKDPKLNQMYFSGNVARAMRIVFDRQFGALVKAMEKTTGGADGAAKQAREAAAKVEEAKEKTAKLPRAPARTGSPPGPPAETKPNLLDPKVRKQEILKRLEELAPGLPP